MPTTDELVSRARSGDRAAIEAFLAEHAGRVARFAGTMCRSPEDAEDVVQETLIAAARTLPEFRGASSVATWLFTIARSFCIKKRRKSKFAPAALVSLDDEEAVRDVPSREPVPEEAVASRELGDVVAKALSELDPTSREVLLLRDVEGLTAPEVAEVTGLSVDAVKSRLHRARVAVRAKVEPELRDAPAGREPSCPDVVGLFSRHLEGEITGATCDAMQAHVDACPACAAACDALKRTLLRCRAVATGPVPTDVQATVRRAIRALPGVRELE